MNKISAVIDFFIRNGVYIENKMAFNNIPLYLSYFLAYLMSLINEDPLLK